MNTTNTETHLTGRTFPIRINGLAYTAHESTRSLWKASGPRGGEFVLVQNAKRPDLFRAIRGTKAYSWYRFDGTTFTEMA